MMPITCAQKLATSVTEVSSQLQLPKVGPRVDIEIYPLGAKLIVR